MRIVQLWDVGKSWQKNHFCTNQTEQDNDKGSGSDNSIYIYITLSIAEEIEPIWSWRLLTEGFERIAPLSSE